VFPSEKQHSKPTDPQKVHEVLKGKSDDFKDCFKGKRQGVRA